MDSNKYFYVVSILFLVLFSIYSEKYEIIYLLAFLILILILSKNSLQIEHFDTNNCPAGFENSKKNTFYLVRAFAYNGNPVLYRPDNNEIQTWYIDNQWTYAKNSGNKIGDQVQDYVIYQLGNEPIGSKLCATIVSGAGQDSNGGMIAATKNTDKGYTISMYNNKGTFMGQIQITAANKYEGQWGQYKTVLVGQGPFIKNNVSNRVGSINLGSNFALSFVLSLNKTSAKLQKVLAVMAEKDGKRVEDLTLNSRIPAIFYCSNTNKLSISLGNNSSNNSVISNCTISTDINREYIIDIVLSGNNLKIFLNGVAISNLSVPTNRVREGLAGLYVGDETLAFDGLVRNIVYVSSDNDLTIDDVRFSGIYYSDSETRIYSLGNAFSYNTGNPANLVSKSSEYNFKIDKVIPPNIILQDPTFSSFIARLPTKNILEQTWNGNKLVRWLPYKQVRLTAGDSVFLVNLDGSVVLTKNNVLMIPKEAEVIYSKREERDCKKYLKDAPVGNFQSIRGIVRKDSIGSIQFIDSIGKSVYSGINVSDGEKFNYTCPDGQDIVGYDYNIAKNPGQGDCIFGGLGNAYCMDGTVLPGNYGNKPDALAGKKPDSILNKYLYNGDGVQVLTDGVLGRVKGINLNQCGILCNNMEVCGGFSHNDKECLLNYTVDVSKISKSDGGRTYSKMRV